MQFTGLRLSGFKSFVEATDFVIHPGLTGVVGPNGCGKSNLVEGLRWVMGENSPKKMRGGAMDDMIFAGTATRPARNLAEVTLFLDNSHRRAPAAFNDSVNIEVSRRIERDQGSSYRINGREVRARDVQLLFADMTSGAHSTAMVSQGRIGAVINAKAVDRRLLLEEAAGITGLHSRRHEAELRLHAAELNLVRVDDVVGQLDQQLQGLKRQARQANRYRNLSSHIRKAEAMQLHLRHAEANASLSLARELLVAAEAEVAARTLKVAQTHNAEAAANEALPPLRQAEAEAAARWHRLTVARDGLDAEERAARDDLAQVEQRLVQIAADMGRERALERDAAEAIAKLDAEAAGLTLLQTDEATAQAEAAAEVEKRQIAVGEQQEQLDRWAERAAAEQPERTRLAEAIGDAERRIERLHGRLGEIATERDQLAADPAEGEVAATSVAVELARRAAMLAVGRLQTAEAARLRAQAEESAARQAAQKISAEAARLGAEEAGLAKLLAVNEDDLWPPLIDALTVAAGYEKALGAALGDDLVVPADEAAPIHWQVLPPFAAPPPLPVGAAPLADFVSAPAALARRLSQIGVVDDATGAKLARQLSQGQRLVSRGGALWRWDGYTARAGAPLAATTRLEQRRRLAELRVTLREVAIRHAAADATLAVAQSAAASATDGESAERNATRNADAGLNAARDAQAVALERAARRASRLAALDQARDSAEGDSTETENRLTSDSTALAALPPAIEARDRIASLRHALDGLRQSLAEARAAHELMRREAMARVLRLDAIASECRGWRLRGAAATQQLGQLAERQSAAAAERQRIAALPAEIALRRVNLLGQIAAADNARAKAADALTEAESLSAARGRAARAAEAEMALSREERVRRQAEAEHALAALAEIASRIRTALDCLPDQALAAAGIAADEALPEIAVVETRLERLKRERDTMGPVNLRAEIEADEVELRLTTLQTERTDLLGAIDRLRQGIGSLNREGRERLLTAFQKVDEHFRQLFVRLFGGGRAHLSLSEAADPLEAGLEIMASPPGKRLQVMSLLSGGEQALTALALLFAVFLTNPAPICVLDEVDAPLDDANVDRVCDLLIDMAHGGDTRFLVITHHPITMARMDRLFGVTMSERGISNLVSVDLADAEAMRATA